MQSTMRSAVFALVASPLVVEGASLRATTTHAANPIRKVVTLLEAMKKKVTHEGEREEALYQKYMCYCKSSDKTLKEGIATALEKIEQLTSEIKASEEKAKTLKDEIKKAQTDRSAAKSALADAKAVREKEAAAFQKEKQEDDGIVGQLKGAIAALEEGMAGFLQTTAAVKLRQLMENIPGVEESDRQAVASFLEGGDSSGYAPQSGEIVGILKQMLETTASGLQEAEAAEKEAVKTYNSLVAAKKKEIDALTASIESKMTESGELGPRLVQMKNDIAEAKESVADDQGFVADLAQGCKTKESDWNEIVQNRNEELVALSDTIKILNDDDALELFKKTLPSASSFVQVQVTANEMRQRAITALQGARSHSHKSHRAHLDLIALALRGKKVGFEKVVQMIDTLKATLQKEQTDDNHKVEYCNAQLDSGEDKAKELKHDVTDAGAAIETTADALSNIADEIKTLEAGVQALDKSVKEATAQRKSEHAEFVALLASDGAAKELLGFAQNRLNKFYDPKLYKAPPKTELSAGDRIYVSEGGSVAAPAAGGIAGTGITAFVQVSSHVAPPPAPESFGAYSKKSAEKTGVAAMMDLLIADLSKEMTQAKTEEADAQKDYEALMQHSAEKRALDSKALTEKQAAKADMDDDLASHKAAEQDAKDELSATSQFIMNLHSDCDWLLQYADARKEARDNEISGLDNARAVLSGADYSLVQTSAQHRSLRQAP